MERSDHIESLRRQVRVKQGLYSKADKRLVVVCPWCTNEVKNPDLHEAFVKRSAVPKRKQDLIFHICNCLYVCHECHMHFGQTNEMTARCLAMAARTVTLPKVGMWYVGLWQEHKLHIQKGLLIPPKQTSTSTCLDIIKRGAVLRGLPRDLDWSVEWLDAKGRDLRGAVIRYWKGKKTEQPNPVNGVTFEMLWEALESGYWLNYLAPVFPVSQQAVLEHASLLTKLYF